MFWGGVLFAYVVGVCYYYYYYIIFFGFFFGVCMLFEVILGFLLVPGEVDMSGLFEVFVCFYCILKVFSLFLCLMCVMGLWCVHPFVISCVFCFFGWVGYVHSKYVCCKFWSMTFMVFYYTFGIILFRCVLCIFIFVMFIFALYLGEAGRLSPFYVMGVFV